MKDHRAAEQLAAQCGGRVERQDTRPEHRNPVAQPVGLEEPERDNPRLIRALVEAGAEIQFVGELRRTLEDVYLRLVEQSDPAQSS